MFGGLTKTSSRIAIAAALGLTLGGFAFKATPAKAADLGGDCCADLEERVAELEATTVRKGNKKVSVTISGWVVKTMNWWDSDGANDNPDGADEDDPGGVGTSSHFVVGDKDYDLGSRFAITGSAVIAPGWSGGFNLTILAPSTVFGFNANQVDDLGGTFGAISTLYSYIYIKSDTWGTLNWGHLSPASDNAAVLADLSGTVIESNGVFFEGNGFFLNVRGEGMTSVKWGDLLQCQGLGAGIGVDCWGAAQPAVRYDSPTWGGFRFQTSFGKNQLTGANFGDSSDFWDAAAYYSADWNSFKVSAAGSYTWIETGVDTGSRVDLWQVGGSIQHRSGLGVYAMYLKENTKGQNLVLLDDDDCGEDCDGITEEFANPDPNAWFIKPYYRKALMPIGVTTFYGEYGKYNDQFHAGQCLAFDNDPDLCQAEADTEDDGEEFAATTIEDGNFVESSEVKRWGLGVVQEIDSAAMHLFARWQHQEGNARGVEIECGNNNCSEDGERNEEQKTFNFSDWDLFQVGGIIFF